MSYLKTRITNADDETDPDDPNFSCKTCNYKFRDLAGYRFHLRNLHNMVIPYMLAKPNFAIKPDSDDPNFYCKFCSSTYSSRSRFREHLRYTHKMTLPSLKKRDHSVEPDPNGPGFYCKSCFRNYGRFAKYRQHLRNIHNMTLLPVTTTTKKQKCKSTITKNDASENNLITENDPSKNNDPPVVFASHKNIKSKPMRTWDPNAEPDIDDPNFYCKSCGSKYKNYVSYKAHLRSIHQVKFANASKYKRKRIKTEEVG